MAALHADRGTAGLEGGELGDLGAVVAEVGIEGVGVDGEVRPAIAADVATIIGVAEAVETGGIGHRQRLQHDGVNEGENRSVRSDAEGKSDDRGGCEAAVGHELARGEAKVVRETCQHSLYTPERVKGNGLSALAEA